MHIRFVAMLSHVATTTCVLSCLTFSKYVISGNENVLSGWWGGGILTAFTTQGGLAPKSKTLPFQIQFSKEIENFQNNFHRNGALEE